MSDINLNPQQTHGAALAGLDLINRDTTLIPGSIRGQISILGVILDNLARGTFILANPPKPEVQSPHADGNKSGQMLSKPQGGEGRSLRREDLSVIDGGKSSDGKTPEAQKPEGPEETPPQGEPA